MGVRVLEGKGQDGACLYCSTTDWAFGPLFSDGEAAEKFLAYAAEHDGRDLRLLTDEQLQRLYSAWSEGNDRDDAA